MQKNMSEYLAVADKVIEVNIFVGLVGGEFVGHPDRRGQAQAPEKGGHRTAADAPRFGPALIHRLERPGSGPEPRRVRGRGRGALNLLDRLHSNGDAKTTFNLFGDFFDPGYHHPQSIFRQYPAIQIKDPQTGNGIDILNIGLNFGGLESAAGRVKKRIHGIKFLG